MTAKQRIQNMSLNTFIALTKQDQRRFVNETTIDALKSADALPELKKLIALKVLTEARHAVEDQGLLNMTANFRDLLDFFGMNMGLRATPANSNAGSMYDGETAATGVPRTGYRFFHISDMGMWNWNRKFFHLGVDDEHNLVTRHVNTFNNFANDAVLNLPANDLETWDELHHEQQLRRMFALIQKETRYENTFGYDLLSAAMFCANGLLFCANAIWQHIKPLALIVGPLALALNVAIYATVLPPAMTFMVMEHLLINPIKWVINQLRSNEHEAFIQAVIREPAHAVKQETQYNHHRLFEQTPANPDGDHDESLTHTAQQQV